MKTYCQSQLTWYGAQMTGWVIKEPMLNPRQEKRDPSTYQFLRGMCISLIITYFSLHIIPTDSEALKCSLKKALKTLSPGFEANVKVCIHLVLVGSSRMQGAIPILPHAFPWRGV